MLPPLLSHDITQGIKQFLTTGFEPSNLFFQGLMQRFVDNESAWLKGPFLQLGLPFRTGSQGADFFPGLNMQHAGYVHQEKAWQRLDSGRMASNTLVATGTGSGKTECFLYPLLVHAARMHASGGNEAKGIKALVIYPMNALATDQARRFAEAVAEFPAFAGLRVGLFVGGQGKGQSGNPVMTSSEVITDREILRKQPPDILLTNYKMLDYLLIRPKDRLLWAYNSPTTLRYVVVDELHTFDGAQGTDLALLLRRLRARLQTPEGYLICVGTSATLGGNADTSPLREYARQVMGGVFPPESVITEDRRTLTEFLDGASTEHVFEFAEDHERLLDPSRYTTQEEAVKAWFGVFFPSLPSPGDVSSRAFRTELGKQLKSHLLVEKLLKLLDGRVRVMNELVEELRGSLPTRSRPLADPILAALVALLGWARDPAVPVLPLLTLRQQIWLRELRRMVARVHSDAHDVSLVAAADLKAKPDGLFLPLVQCTECRTTGWLGVKGEGGSKVSSDLESIYNSWFDRRPEVMRLYPRSGFPASPQVECAPRLLCGECGHVQGKGEQCESCGFDSLVAVMQVTATTTSTSGNAVFNWHDLTCPTCASRDRLILLGARNATLGAQVIEHSWASPFNDDKKLIAFSDSVQDAAHRAGFFAARTYGNNTRMAIAKALHELGGDEGSLSWMTFLQQLPELWLSRFGRERFVSEFIGPNMLWQQDWERLSQEDEPLPQNSRLPERVAKRLAWHAFVEFTYLNRRGRSLERVGVATLALDLAGIDAVVARLQPKLAQQLGLHQLSLTTLWQWVWGFMTHLRQRGAVSHPELSGYAHDGNVFGLLKTGGRSEWMPSLGNHTPRPIWLSLGQHRYFDHVSSQPGNWYNGWMTTLFVRDEGLLATKIAEPVHDLLIAELCDEGLLVRAQDDVLGDSVALNAERLQLTSKVCQLLTAKNLRALSVPLDAVERLMDLPCLEAFAERYTNAREQATLAQSYRHADIRRVIAAEHTGLLERQPRERLEQRFKAKPEQAQPWYENLLSATPTLEMGVDIGSLSSVLLCSVPPNQASFLQRIGRAGRRDGNALATTLADGSSPHDLYFFNETNEMLSGEVLPPGVFLRAAEVLRRQLLAYCLDDWVGSGIDESALPDKTSSALDAIQTVNERSFPHTFMNHMQVNEQRLLDSFVVMLGDDVDERVRKRLQSFMQGGEGEDSLRMKLFKTLEELVKERALYKKRQTKLKAEITSLKAKPQDDVTREQIDSLDRLRGMAQQQAKAINEKDLLNTLTDAGLIPNYAFPEAGIQLKSMLWRKKLPGEEAIGSYISLPAMNFERPASSALSEFAPENRFFANQRKVEINQIDMQLASPERWRMCPSCHHMQNLELQPDSESECPRCRDVMWADAAQVMTLLRFKQAVANSDDTKVRIDDSAEDREPKFYQRQLLVDFKPADVEVAWSLKSDSLPFGFEFIRHAQFRDINFGERGKGTETLQVANQRAVRSGFKLCRHCGMVQKPLRRKRDTEDQSTQTHAIDCEKRNSEDLTNLIDCLYLYREFSSEALRILVPFTKVGMDERVVQSFMAAVQLGLKKRFGGKVDHLRMTTYDEPGRDDGPTRHYIMLYDSVPGGTGYLHQLLSQEAQTLSDVLRMAAVQLKGCACNDDPDKDGCYSCLYQYRLGRAMNQVSRDCARDILDELLGSLDLLEKVECISDIEINPQFDSLLESRFIASLPRLGSEPGLPRVRLVKEVVKGKSGYQLTVGDEQYWVEMQVELAQADGVAVACKPDCVIWPKLSQSVRRPIAVFCDGWAYHQPVLAADALKRSSLVSSGQFWVWSATWDDVESALEGNAKTDLGSPFGSHIQHNKLPPHMLVDKTLLQKNAIAVLLEWLASPTSQGVDVFMNRQLVSMQGLATQLVCLPTDTEKRASMETELSILWPYLPASLQEKPLKSSVAGSPIGAEPRIRLHWPHSWAQRSEAPERAVGLFLLDDNNSDEKALHAQWRRWLGWYNHLQVLPGMLLATSKALVSGDFAALGERLSGKPSTPGQGDDFAWQTVFNQVVKAVKPGLEELVRLEVIPPDVVGYELPDANGDVLAEAELAWVERKVVLLLDNQDDYAPQWQAQGWQYVIALDEKWPGQVAALIKA